MSCFEVLDIETFVLNNSIEIYCICCTNNGCVLDFYYSEGDVFLKFLKCLTRPQYYF